MAKAQCTNTKATNQTMGKRQSSSSAKPPTKTKKRESLVLKLSNISAALFLASFHGSLLSVFPRFANFTYPKSYGFSSSTYSHHHPINQLTFSSNFPSFCLFAFQVPSYTLSLLMCLRISQFFSFFSSSCVLASLATSLSDFIAFHLVILKNTSRMYYYSYITQHACTLVFQQCIFLFIFLSHSCGLCM